MLGPLLPSWASALRSAQTPVSFKLQEAIDAHRADGYEVTDEVVGTSARPGLKRSTPTAPTQSMWRQSSTDQPPPP